MLVLASVAVSVFVLLDNVDSASIGWKTLASALASSVPSSLRLNHYHHHHHHHSPSTSTRTPLPRPSPFSLPPRLAQAFSAWCVNTQRAPSGHGRDAMVYGLKTTPCKVMSTPLSLAPPLTCVKATEGRAIPTPRDNTTADARCAQPRRPSALVSASLAGVFTP